MKLRNLLTSLIVVLMAAASASAVDQTMVNPSVYNAGDIAFHIVS
mgnify:CR=1 FL=1